MRSNTADLNCIRSCLAEAKGISCDQSLREILFDIRNSDKKYSLEWDNYSVGSFSLQNELQKKTARNQLIEAFSLLSEKKILTDSCDQILEINKKVLNQDIGFRYSDLGTSFPFPRPSSIQEGLNLLFAFLKTADVELVNLFVHRVAFIQGLLSLHPFEDGNHRTSRLLLDYWLIDMGLPPLTLKRGSDLIIANSSEAVTCTLAQAVQKVLFAMGSTLLQFINALTKNA